MQQLFGVVIRLYGKHDANKMFSSVEFSFFYIHFVVFINIMGIAVNTLKHLIKDHMVKHDFCEVKHSGLPKDGVQAALLVEQSCQVWQ